MTGRLIAATTDWAFLDLAVRNHVSDVVGPPALAEAARLRDAHLAGGISLGGRFFDADAVLQIAAAELAGGHGHKPTLRIPSASPGDAIPLHSRAERRELLQAWARRRLDAWSAYGHLRGYIEDLIERCAGRAPIRDAGGNVLTGNAAIEARRVLHNEEFCLLVDAGGVEAAWNARLAQADPATASLPLREAIERAEGEIDAAAAARLRYLFDCDDAAPARTADADQAAALRVVERYRQDGRRAVRACAASAAVAAAALAAAARIEGVSIEHAPAWTSGTGGALPAGIVPWTVPDRNSAHAYSLRVSRGGERRRALDDVVLDPPDLPAGWTVALGARSGDAWPVTLTVPAAAAAGDYDVEMTARDARGPAAIRLRVTVPAASG